MRFTRDFDLHNLTSENTSLALTNAQGRGIGVCGKYDADRPVCLILSETGWKLIKFHSIDEAIAYLRTEPCLKSTFIEEPKT